jgi:6-phosphogluconolactonase
MRFERVIRPTAQQTAEACGERLLEIVTSTLAQRGAANLAVSGGTTPKLLFNYLAASRADWSAVDLFWADERAVPPGDPQSNYTLAHEHWLQPANYPAARIHRIHAELPISEAASRYSMEIRTHFDLEEEELPVFDVIQLGMGADGHTGSLFPGEPYVLDRQGVAAAVYVEKLMAARITLLPGVLCRARHVLMLVAGPDKAEAVDKVFRSEPRELEIPAQLLRRSQGQVTWFLDEAAAQAIL